MAGPRSLRASSGGSGSCGSRGAYHGYFGNSSGLFLGCVHRVTLSSGQYEHVRAVADRFFVVPGHELPTIEIIIETHETYLVVEKTRLAGTIAERTDPRVD